LIPISPQDDKEFTMKRSLQFKRPFAAVRPTALVLAMTLGGALSAWAQSSGDISDAERAKRDASKVFSFIKFHAVKPAAAPTPAAAPKPAAPKPAPRPESSAASASPAPSSVSATAPVVAASSPAATAPSAGVEPRNLPPASEPAPAPVAVPEAVATVPAPAPAVEEEDDPGIKLVKYVAPELNARAMAAMPSNKAKVRVRFTVMPDGSAAKVQSVSNAPRPLAQVAVRAVEQWRFEGVKEPQEVEVEVEFKLDE
jgi:protein TonB